jgi:hypothetical protein
LNPATGVSPLRGGMPERVALSREERRLRRAARREKQRQANIGRARKMHLARVENERSGNLQALAIQDEKRQLYVGCSGWFYWHWRGAIYPADLPTSRWFTHYAGRFKTVELNAPFYSLPTCCNRRFVDTAGRKTPVRLYREGVRADTHISDSLVPGHWCATSD